LSESTGNIETKKFIQKGSLHNYNITQESV
jgi:hypothetical protein